MAPRTWSVEKIVNEKIENGCKLFEVVWTGWPTTTWEPEKNIVTKILIEEYEGEKRKNRTRTVNGASKTPAKSTANEDDIVSKTSGKRGSKTPTAANLSVNGNSASIVGKRNSRKGSSNHNTPVAVAPAAKKISATNDSSFLENGKENGSVGNSKVDFDFFKRLNDYKTEKLGFEKNLTPEKIIGALDNEGELLYLITWKKSQEKDFVFARDANDKCPQLVIEFLQSKIKWNCPANV